MKGYKIIRHKENNKIISISKIDNKSQVNYKDKIWYAYFVKNLDKELLKFYRMNLK